MPEVNTILSRSANMKGRKHKADLAITLRHASRSEDLCLAERRLLFVHQWRVQISQASSRYCEGISVAQGGASYLQRYATAKVRGEASWQNK